MWTGGPAGREVQMGNGELMKSDNQEEAELLQARD